MAVATNITRRFALLGASASTVALAVPATKALAAAHGHFVSDQDFALLNFIKTAPTNARAFYHATALAKTLREQRGGSWKVTNLESTDTITGIVMFVGHRGHDEPNSIPQL